MAYPTVVSTSSGTITDNTASSHTIPLPSGMQKNDFLIIYISCPYNAIVSVSPLSSFNIYEYKYRVGNCYSTDHSVRLVYSFCWANGGGVDSLVLDTLYCDPSFDYITNHWVYHSRISYMCYAVRGVYETIGWIYEFSNLRWTNTTGATNTWDLGICPAADDSLVDDYIWIATIAAPLNGVATIVPSGFTDLLTVQGSALYFDSTSLSSARYTTTAVSQLNPGGFTGGPACNWVGQLIRIYPTSSVTPPTDETKPPTTVGVGTYIYKENAYAYITPIDSIEVSPTDLNFHSDTTPYAENPYQIYVQVISSGTWTASWWGGVYFTASALSGVAGVTYISINCVGNNDYISNYTDTLVFDGPGITTDSVNVIQYCPPL
jgi:hypothetical protein